MAASQSSTFPSSPEPTSTQPCNFSVSPTANSITPPPTSTTTHQKPHCLKSTEGKPRTLTELKIDFDATICLIAGTPHPTIPTFSPQDPHLIQTIMTWLQRIILET